MFVPSDDTIIYDLNRRIRTPKLPVLSAVARHLRFVSMVHLLHCPIVARMTLQSSTAAGEDFAALKEWRTNVLFKTLRGQDPNDIKAPTLLLCFVVGSHAKLEDVRLDAMALVRSLPTRTHWENIFGVSTPIQVQLFSAGEETTADRRASADIRSLLQALLAFLVNVSESHPQYRERPCSQVWANGSFKIREAELQCTNNVKQILTIDKRDYTPCEVDKERLPWTEECKTHVTPEEKEANMRSVDTLLGCARGLAHFLYMLEERKACVCIGDGYVS